jgi:ubiquinone/menaquinone biosynthesis C-methylase UbiE
LNKEEIQGFLSNYPKRDEKKELYSAQKGEGRDCPQIANQIFPIDLEGGSVLDIGCGEGFFSFEAKKRNAGRVVGIDANKEYLAKAIKLSGTLSTDMEFQESNFSDVERFGKFDYVLCLESLHLVEDPIDFVHRLIRIAGRKLILAFADLRPKTSKTHHRLWRPLLTLLPHRFQPSVLILDQYGKYLMTRRWIEGIFQNRYSSIERVEFLDSDGLNRHLVVATMRRLDNLRVLSGPSGVGKSVLIDRLRSGDPSVVNILGFTLEDGWPLIMAKDLKTYAGREIDRLLLHYDIAKPIERSSRIHDDDPALIITRAVSKVVYVLVCPPEVLIERVQMRMKNSHNSNNVQRAKVLVSEYSQPVRLRRFYEDWISYCQMQRCEIKYLDVTTDRVKAVTKDEAFELIG